MLKPPELKKGHGFFHHLEAKFDLHVSTNVARTLHGNPQVPLLNVKLLVGYMRHCQGAVLALPILGELLAPKEVTCKNPRINSKELRE